MTRWRVRLGLGLTMVAMLVGLVGADVVPAGKAAPELAGGAWINSEPLTMRGLRGRVVLIDFWTYG